MRKFKIIGFNNKVWARLTYDESTNVFNVLVPESIYKEVNPPLSLLWVREMCDKGRATLPVASLEWVRERLVPPSRLNIDEILRTYGLDEYDEFPMLLVNSARCHRDELYIEEEFDDA